MMDFSLLDENPPEFERKKFTVTLNNGIVLTYEGKGTYGTLYGETKEANDLARKADDWLLVNHPQGYVNTGNNGRTPASSGNHVAVMYAVANALRQYEPKFSIEAPASGSEDESVIY